MSPEVAVLAAGLVLGAIFRKFLPGLVLESLGIALGALKWIGLILLGLVIIAFAVCFPVGALFSIFVWICWPWRKDDPIREFHLRNTKTGR